MPRQEVKRSSALPERRGQDRCHADDQDQPRQQLGGPNPGEQVADDRHGDDGHSRPGQALQGTGDREQGDGRRECAEHATSAPWPSRPNSSGLAASDGVGQRSDDQLAEAEAEQQTRDRQLRLRGRRVHLGGQLRQGRQIGVDGQRTDGAHQTENQDELEVATTDEARAERRSTCATGGNAAPGSESRVRCGSSSVRAGAEVIQSSPMILIELAHNGVAVRAEDRAAPTFVEAQPADRGIHSLRAHRVWAVPSERGRAESPE